MHTFRDCRFRQVDGFRLIIRSDDAFCDPDAPFWVTIEARDDAGYVQSTRHLLDNASDLNSLYQGAADSARARLEEVTSGTPGIAMGAAQGSGYPKIEFLARQIC